MLIRDHDSLDSNPVRLAVIGAGYWGINLIRNFAQTSGCELVVVCEPNRNRWPKVKACSPNSTFEPDFLNILAQKNINAVVIATPPDSHFPLAHQALRAGKHVLVEKPLAMSTAQGRELIALAEQQDLQLMVGHTFEYNPAVIKIKKLMEAGELGRVYYLYSQRLNLGIVRPDVNVIWSLAPHDISILHFLLEQEPLSVSATGHAYLQEKIEDVAFLNLEFEDGLAAHVHVSWLDPGKVRRMTVVGDQKMVVYDDTDADGKIRIYDKGITRQSLNSSLGEYKNYGEFQFIHRAGDLNVPKIDFAEPLATECAHFVECVAHGKKLRTDGWNGLRVVQVLEAADISLRQGGRRVSLNEMDPVA